MAGAKIGMALTGLKAMLLAAGLALGGVAAVAQTAPAAQAPAAEASAAPAAAAPAAGAPAPAAGAAPAAEAPVATALPAAVADPTLDGSGARLNKPVVGMGQPVDRLFGIQPQVTPNGREAAWFHNVILLPLITVISLFVLGLLVWVILRYRQAANPVPSRNSHNTFIEVVWTLAPVLILVAIAVPSIKLLAAQYRPAPEGAVTLKAIGNQWYWSYEFPDHGGVAFDANMLKEQADVPQGERYRVDGDGPRLLATDNRVVLPVGVPIRLLTTANDVIHSWAMPAFWFKLDAVPGKVNEGSFTIEKPGVYFGQCSELCGARHAYMPIVVEAVAPEVFARWIASKGGTMPGAAAPSAAGGVPQPASDVADDTATPPEGAGVPVENATVTTTNTSQGATANPGGAGNTDQ